MLTALNKNMKVIARDVQREDGPFSCPGCKDEVLVKKGRIKIHHFAHKINASCLYGQGESESHMKAKQEIYDCLCEIDGIDCEMEKFLGQVRADVYVCNKKTNEKFAIEIQISNLSLDQIIHRTKSYYELGINVLWLPVLSEHKSLLNGDSIYQPRVWENWLHALYFGRVYYWKKELEIIPVHFSASQKYVDMNEYGGGYFKTMKIERRVEYGTRVWFPYHFAAMNRRGLNIEKLFIPESSIAIDKNPIWWKKSF